MTPMWLLGTHCELAFPHGDHGPPHGNMLEGSAPLAHKKIILMLENTLNTLILVFKTYVIFLKPYMGTRKKKLNLKKKLHLHHLKITYIGRFQNDVVFWTKKRKKLRNFYPRVFMP